MKTFIVVFNTEGRSDEAFYFMNRFIKDDSIDSQMALSALHLSVFLVRTHWDQGQLVARLDEMNDDSIRYWIVEHTTDCVYGQLDEACRWAKKPSGDDQPEPPTHLSLSSCCCTGSRI